MTYLNVSFPLDHNKRCPSDFDKLLKLSSFRKELLRFFFEEIEHLEYAVIIGEKILYFAINKDAKNYIAKMAY